MTFVAAQPRRLGSRPLARRIEVSAQARPAIYIVVWPLFEGRRIFGQALWKARFEQKGHGIAQLYRLEFAVARMFESRFIRAVWQHAIVQRDAAGHEALRLRVIDAVDQAHELRHQVAVIPGRPEGVLRHLPPLREDDE